MDMTTRMSNGQSRTTHTESEMKFIGPDCGDVKPMAVPKGTTAAPKEP